MIICLSVVIGVVIFIFLDYIAVKQVKIYSIMSLKSSDKFENNTWRLLRRNEENGK